VTGVATIRAGDGASASGSRAPGALREALRAVDPAAGRRVLEPEGRGPGFWVGAPCVFADPVSGERWLYVRWRNPRPGRATRPDDRTRGWRCSVFALEDGPDGAPQLHPVWELTKEELGARSIEGAALRRRGDRVELFLSWETHTRPPRWRVDVLSAEHPRAWRASERRPVAWDLPAARALSVKDPVLFEHGGREHLAVDYFRAWRRPWSSTALLTDDGSGGFRYQGDVFPAAARSRWARALVRVTDVLPDTDGVVAFVDGTDRPAGVCEEASGLAVGGGPGRLELLDPEAPAFRSRSATGSCRYWFAEPRPQGLRLWYEHAEPGGEHALRCCEVPVPRR